MNFKSAAIFISIFALAVAALASTAALAAKLSPADRSWIDTCIDQLKREHADKTVVRKYCVCIHEIYQGNAKVSQSDMEHEFPPVHLRCSKESGRK